MVNYIFAKITPKWPKNDARIYTLFPQIFLIEKAVLQTFSLLECMGWSRSHLASMADNRVSHQLDLIRSHLPDSHSPSGAKTYFYLHLITHLIIQALLKVKSKFNIL